MARIHTYELANPEVAGQRCHVTPGIFTGRSAESGLRLSSCDRCQIDCDRAVSASLFAASLRMSHVARRRLTANDALCIDVSCRRDGQKKCSGRGAGSILQGMHEQTAARPAPVAVVPSSFLHDTCVSTVDSHKHSSNAYTSAPQHGQQSHEAFRGSQQGKATWNEQLQYSNLSAIAIITLNNSIHDIKIDNFL